MPEHEVGLPRFQVRAAVGVTFHVSAATAQEAESKVRAINSNAALEQQEWYLEGVAPVVTVEIE